MIINRRNPNTCWYNYTLKYYAAGEKKKGETSIYTSKEIHQKHIIVPRQKKQKIFKLKRGN